MTTIIFSGPSTYGLDLPDGDAIVLNPPAIRGDIVRAAKAGAEAILLIDGMFGSVPSVWHKEIVFALSEGVSIYGAASLGALRAVECEAYGMIGLGGIFEDYRDGRLVDDGDVGVLHGPAELGFQPLTVALVDADAAITDLVQSRVASRDEADALAAAARKLHFSRRDWRGVIAESSLPVERAAVLEALLRAKRVSRKRRDAEAAVRVVTNLSAHANGLHQKFVRTRFFDALERDVATARR